MYVFVQFSVLMCLCTGFVQGAPASAMNGCVYDGKTYLEGETWQDGCNYTCTCLNGTTMHYSCQALCPTWTNVPDGCSLQTLPGECCQKPVCIGGVTLAVRQMNACSYKGLLYREGTQWKDGCDFNCTCIDGSTGYYRCSPLCKQYTNIPEQCTLKKVDDCCSELACPANMVITHGQTISGQHVDAVSGISAGSVVSETTKVIEVSPRKRTRTEEAAPREEPILSGMTQNVCNYKGLLYREGTSWKDGCAYNCTCVDGSTGYYRCISLCKTYTVIPPSCKLVKVDECCSDLVCPDNTIMTDQSVTMVTQDGNITTGRGHIRNVVSASSGHAGNVKIVKTVNAEALQLQAAAGTAEGIPGGQRIESGVVYRKATIKKQSVCMYKGVMYRQGTQWKDGCDFNCTCVDGSTGYYTCSSLCKTYTSIPKACRLEKVNECCSEVVCPNTMTSSQGTSNITTKTSKTLVETLSQNTAEQLTSTNQQSANMVLERDMGVLSGTMPNTCNYKGKFYEKGDQWTDGCNYRCTCVDGTTGYYKCVSRCKTYIEIPQDCSLQKVDECCSELVCNGGQTGMPGETVRSTSAADTVGAAEISVKEVRVQTSGEVVKEQLQTVITDVTVPASQKTLLKGSVEAKATTSNVPIVRTGQEGLQTLGTGTGTARTVDSSQTNNSATGAATDNKCTYKGEFYHQGSQWRDGCTYMCTCVDGSTGSYNCVPLCKTFETIPDGCVLLKVDECCNDLVCQTIDSGNTSPVGTQTAGQSQGEIASGSKVSSVQTKVVTTHDATVSAETNLGQVGTLDNVAPVGKETVVITSDQGSVSEPSASTVIENTVVKTMTSGQSASRCRYLGQFYRQGEHWRDGCKYDCVCVNAVTGYYKCERLCKTFAEVPEGCSPQPVDECCSELVCATTNSTNVNAVVSAVSVQTQTQTTELTNQDLANIPHRRIGGSNLIKTEMFEGTRAAGLMTRNGCVYKDVHYKEGEQWLDGCNYNCTCVNGNTGLYRCVSRCMEYTDLPPGCTLRKINECCFEPECPTVGMSNVAGMTGLEPNGTFNAKTALVSEISPISKTAGDITVREVLETGPLKIVKQTTIDSTNNLHSGFTSARNSNLTISRTSNTKQISSQPVVVEVKGSTHGQQDTTGGLQTKTPGTVSVLENTASVQPNIVKNANTITVIERVANAEPNLLNGTENVVRTSNTSAPASTIDVKPTDVTVEATSLSSSSGNISLVTVQNNDNAIIALEKTAAVNMNPIINERISNLNSVIVINDTVSSASITTNNVTVPERINDKTMGSNALKPSEVIIETSANMLDNQPIVMNKINIEASKGKEGVIDSPLTGASDSSGGAVAKSVVASLGLSDQVITGTCLYAGQEYNEGDHWRDGCRYNCTCIDGRTGYYKCIALCKSFSIVPEGCGLQKIDECCSDLVCDNTVVVNNTSQGSETFAQPMAPSADIVEGTRDPNRPIVETFLRRVKTNACEYKGNIYKEGEEWRDGCKFNCTCVDGKTGYYTCTALCKHYPDIPQGCRLQKVDECCSEMVCQSSSLVTAEAQGGQINVQQSGGSVEGIALVGETVTVVDTGIQPSEHINSSVTSLITDNTVNVPVGVVNPAEAFVLTSGQTGPQEAAAPAEVTAVLVDKSVGTSDGAKPSNQTLVLNPGALTGGTSVVTGQRTAEAIHITENTVGASEVIKPSIQINEAVGETSGQIAQTGATATEQGFQTNLQTADALSRGPTNTQTGGSMSDGSIFTAVETVESGIGATDGFQQSNQAKVQIMQPNVQAVLSELMPFGCFYNGSVYQEGETWRDGCKFNCNCINGSIGYYTCQSVCKTYSDLPQECSMRKVDECCYEPVCPSTVVMMKEGGSSQMVFNRTGHVQSDAIRQAVLNGEKAAMGNACRYSGQEYKQGDSWLDGCKYNCTCIDGATGYYRCLSLCKVYTTVPKGCSLQKVDSCCSELVCPGTGVTNLIMTSSAGLSGATDAAAGQAAMFGDGFVKVPGDGFIKVTQTDFGEQREGFLQTGTVMTQITRCSYKGQLYKQGDSWIDGCKYNCSCVDESTGLYRCDSLCKIYTTPLPEGCTLQKVDECCSEPVCAGFNMTIMVSGGMTSDTASASIMSSQSNSHGTQEAFRITGGTVQAAENAHGTGTGSGATVLMTDVCNYNGTYYKEGEKWLDGCKYSCACVNGKSGYYQCNSLCKIYTEIPLGCTLKKIDECCYEPDCSHPGNMGASATTNQIIARTSVQSSTSIESAGTNAASSNGTSVASSSGNDTTSASEKTGTGCRYRGTFYQQGETWKDGCKYDCKCVNGKIGYYACRELCFKWTLPEECHIEPPAEGKCCGTPVCPGYITINYPPNYVQN